MNDDVTVAPSSPMQVMRAGNTLSADVAQHLASEIALTALRERDRRDVTRFGAPLIGLIAGGATIALGAPWPVIGMFGCGGAAAVLFISLVLGVRNRALLDQAAVANAVPTTALLAAVRAVRAGAGASSALRAALDDVVT